MESSSSGSSRRATTSRNGSSVPSCTVDRCTADLSNCRDYHRRHKVCERHSKTPIVFIKGHEQRFCQQCSRFHSLVEFDEGKRSCRKRLEGHNRRRRKPQRDDISVNSSRLFTSFPGTRYIHFGASQILSESATSEPLSSIVNGGVESNRALSLLSSPPAESHMARPESNPRAQSFMSSLNYSCTDVETEPVGSANPNLSSQNMSHLLLDGPFTTSSQPTLSYSWE